MGEKLWAATPGITIFLFKLIYNKVFVLLILMFVKIFFYYLILTN